MITTNDFWNNFKSCEIYNIKDLPDEIQETINLAKEECQKAYAPYSNYSVGAVIVTKSGRKIASANSETCNFDSACAEAGAVSEWTKSAFIQSPEGQPVREEISYIVVFGKPIGAHDLREDVFVTPCGRCRQRLYEHSYGNTPVIGCNETGDKARIYKLSDLLPFAFTPMNLK